MILHAQDLTIGYSASRPVLQHLAFSLPRQSLTCIIGDNGVGKSTLLRTITGAIRPLRGSIFYALDDTPRTSLSAQQRARLFSVVLTDPIADDYITIRDLVSMGRIPYTGFFGSLSDTDISIVDSAIALMQLQPIAGSRVSQVSDGQRQRALIAKALAQQCPVMILDEPTAFLDYKSRIELMKMLKGLALEGKSILVTTHDVDLARQFADWMWVVENGRIIQGTPQDCAALLPSI